MFAIPRDRWRALYEDGLTWVSGDAVVVGGQVSNAAQMNRALDVAKRYTGAAVTNFMNRNNFV